MNKASKHPHTILWGTRALLSIIVLSCSFGASKSSIAKAPNHGDVRVALLVANQRGWQEDPQLRYAISGDLRPLASKLRSLGFQVYTLENQGSQALRKMMIRLSARLQRPPKVTTFLFYYSGHADQHYLHLGPRQQQPVHHKELATFLSKLPSKRRIAVLDACYSGALIRHFGNIKKYRKMFHLARSKGVRKRNRIDLKRMLLPGQGKEQGIRIIASSLGLSWELPKHKASTFTHFMLKGLRGSADLDRDGRVSIDELFDFTSREVQRLTGQRPQQLALIKRSTPYALAPVYQSRLYIQPHVRGIIRVSIANFVWSAHKQHHRGLRLAVVNGKGTVFIRYKQACRRQQLTFPKNGEARLQTNWTPIKCPKLARTRKGQVLIDAVAYRPPPIQPTKRPQLAIGGGVEHLENLPLPTTSWKIQLTFRWRWLHIGTSYQQGQPTLRSFHMPQLALECGIGWPVSWKVGRFYMDLWLGGIVFGGAIWQRKQEQLSGILPMFGGGGASALSWWFAGRWGVRLAGLAGIHYAPLLDHHGISFHGRLTLSMVVAL